MSNVSLLPHNATPQERALAESITRISDAPVRAGVMWNPDTCPASVLPWLAWAFSVDGWSDAWTEAQKRAAIKASFGVHQRKGTVGAVKRALASLGYVTHVREWIDGDFTFGVDIEISQTGIAEADYLEAERLALATKNARSHLTKVRAIARTDGGIHWALATVSGESVSVEPYQLTLIEPTTSLHYIASAAIMSESVSVEPDRERDTRKMFAAGAAGMWLDFTDPATMFEDAAGTIPATVEKTVALVRDKSGRGMHATQADAAKRPKLTARVNLLLRSEQFDAGEWVKRGVTVTADAAAAPDGKMTADRLDGLAAPGSGDVYNNDHNTKRIAQGGAAYSPSIYIKRVSTTGTLVIANPMDSALGRWAVDLSALGDGWERITAKHSAVTVETEFKATSGGFGGMHIFGRTAGLSVYAWGAQIEPGVSVGRYQRVSTAAEYDSKGFPHRLDFSGGTRGLVTPAIDFTSSPALTFAVGVRKHSDSGTQMIAELSGSADTNDGAAALYTDATGPHWATTLKGTATASTLSAGAVAAPATAVVTALFDIGATLQRIRVNGAQSASATPTTGGGSFGKHALNIGSRAGATLPFDGEIFGVVAYGALMTDEQASKTERYVAHLAGVVL